MKIETCIFENNMTKSVCDVWQKHPLFYWIYLLSVYIIEKTGYKYYEVFSRETY
jgi:hypothetical protein